VPGLFLVPLIPLPVLSRFLRLILFISIRSTQKILLSKEFGSGTGATSQSINL